MNFKFKKIKNHTNLRRIKNQNKIKINNQQLIIKINHKKHLFLKNIYYIQINQKLYPQELLKKKLRKIKNQLLLLNLWIEMNIGKKQIKNKK